LGLPNWELGEASRDSAYALANSCTRVHQRQGAWLAERANSPGRVPPDLLACRGTSGAPRDGGRKTPRGRMAGPDAGGWPTAAASGSQTTRFERFTLQASTSGGGIDWSRGQGIVSLILTQRDFGGRGRFQAKSMMVAVESLFVMISSARFVHF